MLNSLSGRFLILTTVFVMLAEVMVFVPSVARFRQDYLLGHLERAQIASLALLATDESLTSDLESELLQNAGVLNVVLRRDNVLNRLRRVRALVDHVAQVSATGLASAST